MLTNQDIQRRLQKLGKIGVTVLEDVSPALVSKLFVYKVHAQPAFNEWGRGTSVEAASTGALMERVERVSAYLAPRTTAIHKFRSESRCSLVSLKDLGYCNFQVYENFERLEQEQENAYVEVKRLNCDESFFAPASRVFLRFRAGLRDFSCSTGLAAHFSKDEAIVRGFLEVLERHIHHIVRFNDFTPRVSIRLESIQEPSTLNLVTELKSLGFSITAALTVPVEGLCCVIVELTHATDILDPVSVHGQFHVGIHFDKDVAFQRALTECLVPRVASGSKALILSSHLNKTSTPFNIDAPNIPRRNSEVPICDNTKGRLESIKKIATDLGLEIYWCDLTSPELTIPVVRVLVPGLQPNFDLMGHHPRDPRSRLTKHLDKYDDWMTQVQEGNFEGSRSKVSVEELPRAVSRKQRQAMLRSPFLYGSPSTRVEIPKTFSSDLIIARLIKARKSKRSVSGSVSVNELSTILHTSLSASPTRYVSPWGFIANRGYPSGGSLHSLQLIIEICACGDLIPGYYIYAIHDGSLYRIEDNAALDIAKQTRQEKEMKPALIIRFIRFGIQQREKYGDELAEKFSFIEAGHLAQNILLTCAELGLNAVPLGNVSIAIPKVFDNFSELGVSLVYSIAMGREESV